MVVEAFVAVVICWQVGGVGHGHGAKVDTKCKVVGKVVGVGIV